MRRRYHASKPARKQTNIQNKTHRAKIREGHVEASQKSTKRQRLLIVHSRGTEPERKQGRELFKIHTLRRRQRHDKNINY